jgi:hypothetical protein
MKFSNNMSTNDINFENKISLYPNPAKDYATITSLPDASIVRITDITGKYVFESVSETVDLTISTVNFANGIYIIRIESKDKIATEKLLINK